MKGRINEISELRNTTLSLHGLNIAVTIVMSSPAELYENRVPARVCYLLIESGVRM